MKKVMRLVSYKCLPEIFAKLAKQAFPVSVLCIVMFFQTGTARAVLPVTGYPVPELAPFDNLMQSYMANLGLNAGILAVSKDGRVVYQRGFGYAYNGTDPLPENTPMRLASVEKPHTAAVIHHLIAYGIISLNDFVFDVGQPSPLGERRLLDAHSPSSTYYPYNGVYGNIGYLGAVRIDDLLNHRGGWDRQLAYDPFGRLLDIGNATGTYPSSPPSRGDIVRYMMSEPMQFDPSNPVACIRDANDKCLKIPTPCYCDPYSNYGYMLLSLIIEQETGQQHTEMIRQLVMTPDIWVPSTEIFLGKDLRSAQNQREPMYIKPGDCINLRDPYNVHPPLTDLTVPCPYGGILMEVKTGEGNLVGSAAPLMMFMNHYDSWFGTALSGPINRHKNGGLAGTSTRIEQRADGFNVVVLFPHSGDHEAQVASQAYLYIDLLGGSVDWDSLSEIDGFWVDFNASSSGFGGHNDPFHTMDETLSATTDGTKLRFKPGSSSWTGTISKHMMLNAPSGTAIIGQ
jgi:CubicO group peptidase (beta-lactamase class C family)